MSISADILVMPQPVVVAVPPPQARTAVAPASERENTQNQRRDSSKNQNAPLSFRAALSAATANSVAQASDGPAHADESEEPFVREARFPVTRAVELTGAEAGDLFTRAVANNERKSRSPAFAAAVSQYAASYFAGSSFHARPGESLELTA